ncbi:MAG TPA: hypothetical protein VD838_00110 [Anaeromyxobacteraceae bacterium]|nr:hypothetical protein [Anaeromyxobacteraceae bacterium]
MGGPSRESYLQAEAAKRERIAAKRTRDGVVDLAEWRHAVKMARHLVEHFGNAPWLLEVRVAEGEIEWLELHVITTRELEWPDRPGITALDDLPIRFISRNPKRSSGDRGGRAP